MEQFWKISGILIWSIIGLIVLFRIVYGKNWLIKLSSNLFFGAGLISSSKKLIEEVRARKIQNKTIAEVGTHVLWRLTRIGLFAIFIALIPFILLSIQNKLIRKQNDLFKTQNKSIDIQNNLLESGRRSSLVFLMSNVLDKVDGEIKNIKIFEQENKTPNHKFRLSPSLTGRIIALSRALKPYKIFEHGYLSSKQISPERGQLFIALIKSNLDSITQDNIISEGDFSGAVIGNIKLDSTHLFGANFFGANFRQASLRGSNFNKAELINTIFWGADLSGAKLDQANLTDADFSWSLLRHASCSGATFYDANFNAANLSGANFSYAKLKNVNFSKAILDDIDLREANISQARNLTVTQLKEAKSLFNCEGLTPKMKVKLKKERPCLFTESGCK